MTAENWRIAHLDRHWPPTYTLNCHEQTQQSVRRQSHQRPDPRPPGVVVALPSGVTVGGWSWHETAHTAHSVGRGAAEGETSAFLLPARRPIDPGGRRPDHVQTTSGPCPDHVRTMSRDAGTSPLTERVQIAVPGGARRTIAVAHGRMSQGTRGYVRNQAGRPERDWKDEEPQWW
jgi:hypothetical protein